MIRRDHAHRLPGRERRGPDGRDDDAAAGESV